MRTLFALVVLAFIAGGPALAQQSKPQHGGRGGGSLINQQNGAGRTPGENNPDKGNQQNNKQGGQQQGGQQGAPKQ